MRRANIIFGILTVVLSFSASPLLAQGLIWSLPEDGTLVRYKGEYTQTVRRNDSSDGDLTLTWDRIVELRSVGKEDADFKGTSVPCRWLEIKVETGKSPEGVLDAGPGGIRMYKILVPEPEVRGTVDEPITQARSIFASHIPIAKGYRKLGDEPTQEMETNLFQLYPIASLLRHYPILTEGEEAETSVLAGEFTTKTLNGTVVMETNVYRSTNVGQILRSDEMPFGVVSWEAKTVSEEKGSTDPRAEFRETSVISEKLSAIAIEQNAESEFLVN